VRWGEEKKIRDERDLEECFKNPDMPALKDFSKKNTLDSIKAIYRNVRENYEYRLRYDEAGDFFIREIELKRK
jgi:uncharacterized protein YeeX (DUF496 family)